MFLEQEVQQNQMVVVHIIGWPHVTIAMTLRASITGAVGTWTPRTRSATATAAWMDIALHV